MMTVYLFGALATAMAAMGGAIRFSGPRTGPLTRIVIVVLAGALWPVMAVGALQALGIALLTRWLGAARAADADADAPARELVLAG